MTFRFQCGGLAAMCLIASGPVRAQTAPALPRDDLEVSVQRFVDPPDSARPSCYWWWFNSLVTKESITRDLEAFRAKGMGGVMLVCSSNGYGVSPTPQGPRFLSAEWRELYRHAVREANRLGLELGANLCGGWDMGGPWITPELAGRWYLQSELAVRGPRHFSGKLPLPGARDGYDSKPQLNVATYIDLPLEKVDYRDTAVVAFREQEDENTRISDDRASLLPAKSNRLDANCFQSARTIMKPTLTPWKTMAGDRPIHPQEVIDLTSRLGRDGALEWDVPAGDWVILRTGHRMTGQRVSLALPGGDGYEVDWFSAAATDLQFEKLGQVLIAEAGPLAGRTLRYFATDSFEDGYPNWTPRIIQEFKKFRGYDPTAYLPVLGGRLVGSADISDRFLNDYRKTLADCMANDSYGRLADLCHQHGLLLQAEAAGPSWSQTICFDALKNLGRCDMPQGEFWQDGTFVTCGQNQVTKQAAAAAHIYGRKTASAEAFTSFLQWREAPRDLKPTADRAFCEGINRLVFHTMTATRPEDGKPGYEYGCGTHFTPNVTWWDVGAKPWITYVSRCEYLLQQGRFVADVLFYNGDSAPNLVGIKENPPDLGPGYDYDVCNAEVLLNRLSVKDGKLFLPDGMNYRILALPGITRMPLEVLEKIRDLVEAGATIVGPKPLSDSGLKDYPECDRRIKSIAESLWGDCDGQKVRSHLHGRGRVFWNQPLRDILQGDGIPADFTYNAKRDILPEDKIPSSVGLSGTDDGTFLDYIHRSEKNCEIYFVVNRKGRSESAMCTFRVGKKQPELWDPVTGAVRPALAFRQADGTTSLPLELEPNGSVFVVFRKTIPAHRTGKAGRNFPEFSKILDLPGPWTVHFDPRWGGPDRIEFAGLEDWTKRPESGIKYYSGTAVYRKKFDLPSKTGGPTGPARFYIDLGQVDDIAHLRLNGKDLGTVWTNPWRVEITGIAKPFDNDLEIEVVNLWPNRLIGDAGLPPGQRFTRTNIQRYYAPTKTGQQALLPSGLLGPVAILAEK